MNLNITAIMAALQAHDISLGEKAWVIAELQRREFERKGEIVMGPSADLPEVARSIADEIECAPSIN